VANTGAPYSELHPMKRHKLIVHTLSKRNCTGKSCLVSVN
jgi:hypothetical protein